MTAKERATAIASMKEANAIFYVYAFRIGNHPFIEFCGLMGEYIQACEMAQKKGIDFSDCNAHSGQQLPMAPHMIDYVNEKLDCIFTGRIALCDQRLILKVSGDKQYPYLPVFDDLGPPLNGRTKAEAHAWLDQLRASSLPAKSEAKMPAARKKASKPPVKWVTAIAYEAAGVGLHISFGVVLVKGKPPRDPIACSHWLEDMVREHGIGLAKLPPFELLQLASSSERLS